MDSFIMCAISLIVGYVTGAIVYGITCRLPATKPRVTPWDDCNCLHCERERLARIIPAKPEQPG